VNKLGQTILFALVGAGALAVGLFLNPWTRQAAEPPPAAAAGTLMQAALPDLSGQAQRIDQWKGRVLVVNFWATWCPPCREEIPAFIRTQEKLGPKGLQIVGIAVDQLDKVKPYAAEMRINYPVLVGDLEAIELARQAGNRLGGLPYTIILDRKGNVVKTELGGVNQEKLERIVLPLL
jgi:thiol-disulfide isomerase/thioredoxin